MNWYLNTIWKPKCVNGVKIINKAGPVQSHCWWSQYPRSCFFSRFWNVTWNNNDAPFSEISNTDLQHNWRKTQLIWSESWKETQCSELGCLSFPPCCVSYSYTLWVMVLMTHSSTLLCVVGFVGGCFVLPADSSPPRVGPGRCRGVTTLINCLLSPVCVASCLPCRHVLRGFRVEEVAAENWRRGAEEVREGEVCSGVVSRVCLNSSVAVSNMDHG